MEQTQEKRNSKVAGWSTERMVEKESKHAFENPEEMVQLMSTEQGVVNNMWKTVSELIEEEVMEKLSTFGTRVEIAGRESFRDSGNTSNGMQESRTEKGGDEAAATDEDHGRFDWTD